MNHGTPIEDDYEGHARSGSGSGLGSGIPGVSGWVEAARGYPEVDEAALRTALLFFRAADGVLDAFEAFFASYGLSDGKFNVLMMFLANPHTSANPTPSELAEHIGVTRGTITGLLDGLERQGLVRREAHPGDRRMLAVRLTDEGRDLMGRLMPDYFRRAAALMGGLDEGERRQLVALLGKVYAGVPAVGRDRQGKEQR